MYEGQRSDKEGSRLDHTNHKVAGLDVDGLVHRAVEASTDLIAQLLCESVRVR